MAAQIDVLEGPDKGWKFILVGAEMRIGRGAGHHARLTDPAWPESAVRVHHRQGGYLVANGLNYPVYLDGAPLPAGASRTLHHGAVLQPTPATVLKLSIVDVPPGEKHDGGVISVPPVAAKNGWLTGQTLSAAALLVAAGVYGYAHFAKPPGVNGPAASAAKASLAGLQTNPAVAPAAGPDVRFAEAVLTEAVYHDAAGRPAKAQPHYRAARDALARLKSAVPEDALAEVERFVAARLRATS